MSEYQERNIEALDGYGGLYSKHVSAMTTEGLSSKSCIAAELAYRDQKIEELERKLDEAEKVTQWNRDNMIHPAQILTIVEDFDSNEKNGYSYDTLFHYFMDAIQKLCKTGN